MLFIFSCDKDGNITSLDELEQKEYYESEIFDEAHLDIYGKWELFDVTGGFSGGGHDFSPESYLQIVEYGIFGLLARDSIISSGRIVIPETGFDFLLIEFENSKGFGNPSDLLYLPKLISKDTLFLFPHCSDCFSYSYKRVE